MRRRSAVVLHLGSTLAILLSIFSAGLLAASTYTKVGEIKVGGAGQFDYLTVDSATKRLYLSHGTEVVVIDLATNAVVGRIADTPGVHGIAVVPGGNIFTTNGRENKVGVVDPKTLTTIGKIDAGANPDALTYDPKSKMLYVFNHTGGSATIIDPATSTVVATVPLDSKGVETGQPDPGLGRVFVNLEDKDSVAVIDTGTHQVTGNWPIAPAEGGTGMAIDSQTHRLFVGGGKFLVMIDAESGKVVANVPICAGTDATTIDPGTKNIFVSCGDGHITVAHMDSPTKLSVVETIDTARGARTNAIDPATHRVYVAAQEYPPADPGAARGRGPAAIPDSLRVLVYGSR